MLEPPPDASRPSWSVGSREEMVDALPYIDKDYGNPNVKEEINRLVEEEMRRSIKNPTDFLKELPPAPKLNFELRELDLLSKHGIDGWKLYNQHMGKAVAIALQYNERIEFLNRERKYHQQNTAVELNALSAVEGAL